MSVRIVESGGGACMIFCITSCIMSPVNGVLPYFTTMNESLMERLALHTVDVKIVPDLFQYVTFKAGDNFNHPLIVAAAAATLLDRA